MLEVLLTLRVCVPSSASMLAAAHAVFSSTFLCEVVARVLLSEEVLSGSVPTLDI